MCIKRKGSEVFDCVNQHDQPPTIAKKQRTYTTTQVTLDPLYISPPQVPDLTNYDSFKAYMESLNEKELELFLFINLGISECKPPYPPLPYIFYIMHFE